RRKSRPIPVKSFDQHPYCREIICESRLYVWEDVLFPNALVNRDHPGQRRVWICLRWNRFPCVIVGGTGTFHGCVLGLGISRGSFLLVVGALVSFNACLS